MDHPAALVRQIRTSVADFLRKPQNLIATVAIAGLFVDLLIKPISNVGLLLIVLALSPWIARIIESIELPGGGKVKFLRDLEKASDKADEAGLLAEPVPEVEQQPTYQAIFSEDPTLSLAGLRIELEQRIRKLVEIHGVWSDLSRTQLGMLGPLGKSIPLSRAVSALGAGNVLSQPELSAIRDLLPLLNRAAHSKEYSRAAAEWAIDIGPRLLAGLDEKIKKAIGL